MALQREVIAEVYLIPCLDSSSLGNLDNYKPIRLPLGVTYSLNNIDPFSLRLKSLLPYKQEIPPASWEHYQAVFQWTKCITCNFVKLYCQ